MDWKYLYTSFDGRINRAKFWAGVGVIVAVGILINIIDALLGMGIDMGGGATLGVLGLLFSLAAIYPAIALYAKRWHDRGKSGWWSLIVLIPIIGPIWALVELGALEGTRGPNQYGPDPLG